MSSAVRYILGLDIGSASVGWACIAVDREGTPLSLLRAGVRIFEPGVEGSALDIAQGKDQSKAVNRRMARLHRRQLRRRVGRQRDLFRELQRAGLLPTGGAGAEFRHTTLNQLDREIVARLDVQAAGQMPLYMLRKYALNNRLEPNEVGRVLFHLSQRRGFLSNRKDAGKQAKADEDLGAVKDEIRSLAEAIRASGEKTLGAYLAGLNPHEQKVRGRWTARQMFVDEFGAIWAKQEEFYPQILTPALRDRVAHLLFFQRPIAKQAHLIGGCELEPGQRRAPWATLAAQRFRLLQRVNDLRIEDANGEEVPLIDEQRAHLLDLLQQERSQTFVQIKAHLHLPRTTHFNLERGGEKTLPGNRTESSMQSVFGARWEEFSTGKRNGIVETWRNSENDDELLKEARYLGLDEAAATRLLQEKPAPDYCALSLKGIEKLSPLMEAGMPFKEAEKQVYGSRHADMPVLDQLPLVRVFLPSLRNPAVERALTEMRKVVNALVREFGKPHQVRIELARELKKPRALRVKDSVANRKREAENNKLAKRMAEECGLQNPTRRQMEKAKLWVEQKGVCPYTGTGVPFSRLFQDDCGLDVDHILPRSRYPDDSYQNKVLCSLEENRNYKRNQTPFEAYAPEGERWSQILSHVKSWGNSGKLAKFLLDSPEKLETDFTARQLNDTRHTSRLAARLLGALYGGTVLQDGTGGSRQVIFSSSGTLTAVLRKTWGFEGILQGLVKAEPNQTTGKPRTDHRHHAIDAIVIALTRNTMIQQMARDNQLRPWQPGSRAWHRVPESWSSPDLFASIREQVAAMHVSHRPEHKISGELHKGSNYGRPRLENGKSVVHNRVALAQLSAKDIDDDGIIVDEAVREAVRTKLAELGGDPKLFAVAGNEPVLPAGQGRTVPIRKVRIRENKTPLKVGQGVRERWVSSGGINHVEIFVQRDAKHRECWISCVVQRPEAYERRRRKLPVVARSIPNSDAEFLFSLAKDDTLEVDWDGGRAIFRVKKFFDNGQIWFVPVNDAHEDAKQTELKIAWSKRPNTLKPLRTRKVVVDLLGRVHSAND